MPRDSEPMFSITLPFWRQLRWNLVLIFVFLAVTPVAFVALFTRSQMRQQSIEQIIKQLESVSELKEDQIEYWLDDAQSTLRLFLSEAARINRLQAFVAASHQAGPEDLSHTHEQDSLNRLFRDAARAQDFFGEIFLYTAEGRIISGSDPIQVGKIVTSRPYFWESLERDLVQSPYYAVGTEELTMVVTQRLVDEQSGQTIAVLAGRLDMETLGQIMTERTGLGGGETYLVSQETNYLVTGLDEGEGHSRTQPYYSEGINRALKQERGSGVYDSYRDPPVSVIGVYRWLPKLKVAMLAEINKADALASSESTSNFNLLAALIAALAAIVAGLVFARRISKPLVTLTKVSTQISMGALDQRAQVTQRNEIGLLAEAFNSMATQLQEFINSLEQRVAERTRNLRTASEVSRATTLLLDPDELLRQVVNLVRERFNLYYVGLFLLDSSKQFAVLRAGTGEAGRQMLARAHRLEVGGSSMIGRCIAREEANIALHVGTQAVRRYANPLLPNTRSEMALPLRSRGQIIGAMTIQSAREAAFDETDIAVMQTMADQVAVTIDNAQLFAETQAALEEAAATHRRYLRRAWTEYARSRDVSGYQQTQVSLIPLDRQILPEVQQATREGRLLTGGGDGGADPSATPATLVEPIVLRGQIIGALGFKQKPGAPPWSDDDVALIQTVASQLAQAVENLRLSRETERRAAREQLVGAVTARMRESLDLDTVLQTTTREMREALGLHSVMIELEMAGETQVPMET
jgi:GAF domain-containing protein/HAMP domain-containing protein